jgi:hypothetical protein
MKRAGLCETPIKPPHGQTPMFSTAQKTGDSSGLKTINIGDMIASPVGPVDEIKSVR